MIQLGQQHGLSIIHVYVLSSWDFISLITILVLIQQVNDLGIFIFWLFHNITKMLQKLSKLHLSSWPKKNLELTGIFFSIGILKTFFLDESVSPEPFGNFLRKWYPVFFQLRIFFWPLINFQLSLRHFKNQSCPKKDMVGDE